MIIIRIGPAIATTQSQGKKLILPFSSFLYLFKMKLHPEIFYAVKVRENKVHKLRLCIRWVYKIKCIQFESVEIIGQIVYAQFCILFILGFINNIFQRFSKTKRATGVVSESREFLSMTSSSIPQPYLLTFGTVY